MTDFPSKRLGELEQPSGGQIHVGGDLLIQMESLTVGALIHLTDSKSSKQYFVIRLPDVAK